MNILEFFASIFGKIPWEVYCFIAGLACINYNPLAAGNWWFVMVIGIFLVGVSVVSGLNKLSNR